LAALRLHVVIEAGKSGHPTRQRWSSRSQWPRAPVGRYWVWTPHVRRL